MAEMILIIMVLVSVIGYCLYYILYKIPHQLDRLQAEVESIKYLVSELSNRLDQR